MNREPIVLAWSGGKDSSLALQSIRAEGRYEVASLLTTCTEGFRRISMHGVRCSLLNQQIAALSLPGRKVFIPHPCVNDDYEKRMRTAFLSFKEMGITKVAFGDLFLHEIRAYRDRLLTEIGMTAVYPLWGMNTSDLAHRFIRDGFRATLVCVDSHKLDAAYAGRPFNERLLASLPSNVDPCGENGEFHTFVHDGPIFHHPVPCTPGAVMQRGAFHYADLKPQTRGSHKTTIPS